MTSRLGFFGKLPGYGDFIERDLPSVFISTWDAWLQTGLATSQQMLGEHWLDHYLNAPVWRFALSPGCVDEQSWLGVVLPSVDRVGRYFPLTFAQPVTSDVSLLATMSRNASWYDHLVDVGLACLQESPTIEALEEVLGEVTHPSLSLINSKQDGLIFSGHAIQWSNPESENTSQLNSLQAQNYLTEALLRAQFPSYSLWQTLTDKGAAGTLLTSKALPKPHGFTALLTGQWETYGWQCLEPEFNQE